jgi:hypothetical protein
MGFRIASTRLRPTRKRRWSVAVLSLMEIMNVARVWTVTGDFSGQV